MKKQINLESHLIVTYDLWSQSSSNLQYHNISFLVSQFTEHETTSLFVSFTVFMTKWRIYTDKD